MKNARRGNWRANRLMSDVLPQHLKPNRMGFMNPGRGQRGFLVVAASVEIIFNIRQPLRMVIDLSGFSASQQRALFDLLILAMYVDGNLTIVEDDQLQQLLTAFGHSEEFDRQREFDAAVTRMRPFVQSIQNAKEQAALLAESFAAPSQQKQVYAAVQQIMASDKHVGAWEGALLSELALKFGMR
jgi:hypothetical protein